MPRTLDRTLITANYRGLLMTYNPATPPVGCSNIIMAGFTFNMGTEVYKILPLLFQVQSVNYRTSVTFLKIYNGIDESVGS